MGAKKRIPLWKQVIAGSILGTLEPDWAYQIREQWKQQVIRDKIDKLEKKLAESKPENRLKIEREILLIKAKHWEYGKSFKEQWAIEKEAKRRGIKVDDYLIEEYKKQLNHKNER